MKTEKIYNWEYTFSNDGRFNILPDKKFIKPDLFYKYYDVGNYSIDALLNQYIFISHPHLLNDLFDCSHKFVSIPHEIALNNFLIPEDKKNFYTEPEKFKESIQLRAQEKFFRKWGVFSMTGNPKNILMWSHYAQNKGFCIEFDIDAFDFAFHGPFPINYQNDICEIQSQHFDTAVLAQTNIKSEIWKYEEEWRLLVEPPKGEEFFSPRFEELKKLGGHCRKMKYPRKAIKSIILGNKFFEPDEIEVIGNKLKITLQKDMLDTYFRKNVILNFISENKIPCGIVKTVGLNKIDFETLKIECISNGIFVA